MSTVELPSGVHHGTPEGHLAGCKGERTECPALLEHGMSCTYAYVRSTTTPDRYYKAKARNPEPREIARTLGFKPTTPGQALAEVDKADAQLPAPRKPAPPRERTAPMPAPEPTPPTESPAEAAPETPAKPALPPHGTTKRYRRGCRDGCPGNDAGITCRQAAVADARASKAARQAKATTPEVPRTATSHEIRTWATANGIETPANGPVPSRVRIAYELAHTTDPAQPLAEQPHDPSGNTPAPADGAASAPAESTAAEGEDMGHPQHTPATEELIDQVRDRIDMPKPAPPVTPGLLTPEEARAAAGIRTPAPDIPSAAPTGQVLTDAPGPRPEWAEVTTSNEVTAALADRDTALEQRDKARSLAARLWEQLDATEERARTAETALELTLTRWDAATTALAAARRANRFLFKRLITREAELRASLDARIRMARAAAAAAAAGWNFEPATNDAENAPPVRHLDDEAVHVALTPARRGILPWKKHTR